MRKKHKSHIIITNYAQKLHKRIKKYEKVGIKMNREIKLEGKDYIGNRKIKFRGKIKESGMSHSWIKGSLVHITKTYKGEEDEQYCDIYQIIDDDGCAFFIDKDTIGQYIGHHDRNGQEIYEGDILQQLFFDYNGVLFREDVFVVKQNVCGWELRKPNKPKKQTTFQGIHRKEIIGNIYDNPELLKEANKNDGD